VLAADFATTPRLWDALDTQVFCAAIERVGVDLLYRAVLLHDAPETYIGDLTTPMKEAMRAIGDASTAAPAPLAATFGGLAAFDAIEDGIAAAVSARAGLAWPLDHIVEAAVKRADARMLATELRDLMAAPPRSWRLAHTPIAMPAIRPLLPLPAEVDFFGALARAGLDPRA